MEEGDRLFLKGHSKKSWKKRGKKDTMRDYKGRNY